MKKWICMILAVLLFTGCSRKEELPEESTGTEGSTVQETVPFLEELASESEESAEESVPIYPVSVGAGAGIGANLKAEARYLADTGKYENDEDVAYVIGQTLKYEGERIRLHLYVNEQQNDERIETMTTTVFLLNNGVPQPFYWEGAEEETMHATFTADREEMYTGLNWDLSFEPADVPYGAKSAMTLFFVIQENYHFTAPNINLLNGGGGLVFYVTAASETYAASRDVKLPVAGEQGTYSFNPDKDSNYGAIAITNKVTSGDQLFLNTALTAEEQLYATFIVPWECEENTAFDVFAFMDGEPLYAINGSWYYRMYGDPNVLYEVPLDMNKIPPGDHLFCFYWFRPEYEHYLVENEDENDYGVGVGAYVYDVIVP